MLYLLPYVVVHSAYMVVLLFIISLHCFCLDSSSIPKVIIVLVGGDQYQLKHKTWVECMKAQEGCQCPYKKDRRCQEDK